MKRDTNQLYDSLVADLQPVRPLRSPLMRAMSWIASVSAVAYAMVICTTDGSTIVERLNNVDFFIEYASALVAGLISIVAAFYLSVPGYSPRWSWGVMLLCFVWLICSSLASHQRWGAENGRASMFSSLWCFEFIITVSSLLIAALFVLMRRSYPPSPLLLALSSSIGVAGIATFFLQFFHTTHSNPVDFGTHVVAVLVVIGIGTVAGKRVFGR